MQTLDASVVLEGAFRLMERDIDQLETRQKQDGRECFSLALQEVVESWWWEEYMRSEQFNGATIYAAATTFAADAFCYFPTNRKFYQALRATTGNAPALLDASTNSYLPNYAYWAEAKAEPSASDYTPHTTYKLGDQVRSLVDGLVYQLYQLVSDNLIPPGAVYQDYPGGPSASYLVDLDAGVTYTLVPGPNDNYAVKPDNTLLILVTGVAVQIVGPGTLQITTGLPFGTGAALTCTLYSNAGTNYLPPPAPQNWHALVPFTPEISPPGEVRNVGKHDLRNSNNSAMMPFERTLNGVRLPGWDEGAPWAWYRRAVPVITADDYDPKASYTATPPNQITFN